MALQQLRDILNSGDILSAFFGGTDPEHEVLPKAGVETLITESAALPRDVTTFIDKTGDEPTWAEGHIYYANGDFNATGPYNGNTLQLGKEQYIEVINNTGALIPNGSAVHQTGTIGGVITVDLAQANAYSTAIVAGIATMDIADGTTGRITTFGSISGLDTSGFVEGNELYLSDTLAGGFTQIGPDIATVCARVLVSDAISGKLFISIRSLISLPTVYGVMNNGTINGAFTANNYHTIEDYTSEASLGLPTNSVLGTITIPTQGTYQMIANIVANFDTIGNTKEDIFIGLFEDGVLVHEIQDFLGKDSEAGSFYPTLKFDATAGAVYDIRIMCSLALNNVSFSLATFDITSIHLR